MSDIKLYKYETHLHTSQGSLCSPCSGAQQVDCLKACGYDGCFVTDHFFGGNTAIDRRLPWAKSWNILKRQCGKIKSAAMELLLKNVPPGWSRSFIRNIAC